MSKRETGKIRLQLVSDVARAIHQTDSAVHAALKHQHPSRWHPVSTAPYNQDLELRVSEDGMIIKMPFPCRQTNEDEWINVDLGVPLRIQPVEWRAWQQSKSPHPHQSSIFAPEKSAARRLAQWGRGHRQSSDAQSRFPTEPEA